MRGLLGFQDVLDIMEDSFKDVLSKEVKVSLSDDKKKKKTILYSDKRTYSLNLIIKFNERYH
jgi:hypothetical protein